MRVLEWALESQKTVAGKIVSVALSVTLIFSFSNFFYGEDAFAEETENETTEVTVATETTEPQAIEAVGTQEETVAATQTQQETEDAVSGQDSQLVAQAEGDTEDATGTEENTGESTDSNKDPEAAWDAESKTLKISNVDNLDQTVANNFLKELGVSSNEVACLELEGIGTIAPAMFRFSWGQWGTLENIRLKNVQTVGADAFADGKNIKSVHLDSIGVLGDEAFLQNVSLTDLQMRNVQTFARSPFSYCSGLTSITLDGNDGIGDLGTTMFYHCTGLTSVTIRNLNVGSQVFNGCTGLTTATIENADLDNQVFYGCTSLNTVTLKSIGTFGTSLFQNCKAPLALTIQDTTTIGRNAFSNALALTTLNLTNVESVRQNAFSGCANLTSITLNNVTIKQEDLVNESEEGSYFPPFINAGAEGMTLSVEGGSLGGYAFYGCKGLKAATISNTDSIGRYAFQNCTNLENVTLSNINSIQNYAFWNCSNLKTIDSLKNVKESIGGFAFYGCSSLEGLTIDDLTKMGYVGTSEEIMKRVTAILQGTFKLDPASSINEITGEGWTSSQSAKSDNWNTYDNGTQLVQEARWATDAQDTLEVKVDAYHSASKQMDYVFVVDLSASMAQLGNVNDSNARFYDMQSKLLDVTSQLLGSDGYDCRVSIVVFGGYHTEATCESFDFSTDLGAVQDFIKGLAPLNENTDYKLGLNKARDIVSANTGRQTSVVFMSDGQPTRDGENKITDRDSYCSDIKAISDEIGQNAAIYGVLHSVSSGELAGSEQAMSAVCGENVYRSTDTESFGKAVNNAISAVYPSYTLTIPVSDSFTSVSNIVVSASAGEANYDPETNTITWTMTGMPFTKHTLTYRQMLDVEQFATPGEHTITINDGPVVMNGNNVSLQLGDAQFSIVKTVVDPDEGSVEPAPNPEPTPTPTPGGDDGATTGGMGDDGTAGAPTNVGPTAPAATPAAAPVAPAVTVDDMDEGTEIVDDENPLAQPETTIGDDENPLAAFDAQQCRGHLVMFLGIILTVIYGAAVVSRRLGQARKIENINKNRTGIEGTPEGTSQTHGVAHHA